MRTTLLISCIALFLLYGCAPVLLGVGVVTGYTLSGDSAIGNVKAEYRVLWDVCMDKLQSMESEVVYSDESKGVIKARVADNSVVVKINTVNSENQKLRVSARKFFLPKPQFAQKVFLKIVESLE
jgi:hypothetical protein